MTITGIVRIQLGDSRINGILLVRTGGSDPAGDATAFLIASGIRDGSCAQIAGTTTGSGASQAIIMQSASRLPATMCQGATVSVASTKALKGHKTAPRKKTKRAVTRKPKAKKRAGRSSRAKKK
jgi:hypothetical protein